MSRASLPKLRPLLLLLVAACSSVAGEDWPGFRGRGDSRTTARDLPLNWADDDDLAWRVQLPGTGQSSPILWRDTLYVTSVAGDRKERWVLQALDVATGKERWRHTLDSAFPEALSDTRSQAAPTPVAGPDGVFAFFESGECLALTHAGEVRWHRVLTPEVGELANNHGLGGSPTLAGDVLVVPIDQERPSCLLALDRGSGTTRWKAPRPGRAAWSTPLVVGDAATSQVILSGGGTVTAYRADDGRVLWELGGFQKNLVPSPTFGESMLVIAAGSKGSNAAFTWSGGTNAPIARWRAEDVSSGFASPLVHRGRVYFVGTAGVVNCREASTGRLLFDERVSQSVWASPIGAEDRVYLFGEKGATTVLAASDAFAPVATNRLTVSGKVVGVAVGDSAFFVRSQRELHRVGARRPAPADAISSKAESGEGKATLR